MGYSAEEILLEIYDNFSTGLDEIHEAFPNQPIPDFLRGTKNAYIEGLQTIQKWERAKEIGLDWEIESEFPPE